MIRVFHIISHFDVGGAERVALNIAKSKNPNIEYHVVELLRAHSKFTNAFIEELEQSHIKYHRGIIPMIPFHYVFEKLAAITFPLWFIFIYLKYRPQVIHTHTEMPDLATFCFFKLFPCFLRHTKVVRTIHNTQLWYGMKKTGAIIEKWMQRQSNIAISKSVRDEYNKNYGKTTPIIYNGVNSVAQKVYPHLRKDMINILFAGRFEEQKGIDVLISVVKVLDKSNSFFFHIVGSGRMENIIRDGLSGCNNYKISSPIYGLSSYLKSFDYLFMPSLYEGLSILSIEASLACLPVVANDCDGLKDTLPPDWQLKVSNNDVDAYINIFTTTSKQEREKYGDIARQYAQSHFSIEEMQRKYEKIYTTRS